MHAHSLTFLIHKGGKFSITSATQHFGMPEIFLWENSQECVQSNCGGFSFASNADIFQNHSHSHLPAEAVESRPSIATANNNFNDDTSDTGPVNMTPPTLQRTPTNAISDKSDTTATKTYKNLTLVSNSSKMFSSNHHLPQGNQTALNITDYIKLLFNLSHIEPDEDFDSAQVMQKQLNLTHCLYYQIENEKMMYAIFDLWKVYT